MSGGLSRRLQRQAGPATLQPSSDPGPLPDPVPGAAAPEPGSPGMGSPAPARGPAGSPDEAVERLVARMQQRALRDWAALMEGPPTAEVRARLKEAVAGVLVADNVVIPPFTRDALAELVVNELAGYGPVDGLIRDPEVTEVMVNGPRTVFVERAGRLGPADVRFRSDDHVLRVIHRIVGPAGRRIDASAPFVDARLPDGSRVHAIIPPLALDGPTLTIRKFPQAHLGCADLVRSGVLSQEMRAFLEQAVVGRLNVIISGGAGSGKTTLLNALGDAIPADERVVTIEDPAELRLPRGHRVRLEARPPNLEGRGEVPIRLLLRNALRMRPDRIIIGEVRGGEAFDLLQALNTGHEGSLCTLHANSPRDALYRLENMVLMAGEPVPHAVARAQIRSAVDLLVHVGRFRDGRRRVLEIVALDRPEGHPAGEERGVGPPGGEYRLVPLWWWRPGDDGEQFERTAGALPAALTHRMARHGAGGSAPFGGSPANPAAPAGPTAAGAPGGAEGAAP